MYWGDKVQIPCPWISILRRPSTHCNCTWKLKWVSHVFFSVSSGQYLTMCDENRANLQSICNSEERTRTLLDEMLRDPETTIRQTEDNHLTELTSLDRTTLHLKNKMAEIDYPRGKMKSGQEEYRIDWTPWQAEETQVRPCSSWMILPYWRFNCSKFNANQYNIHEKGITSWRKNRISGYVYLVGMGKSQCLCTEDLI